MRLTKFYEHYDKKDVPRILREITSLVLSRPHKLCNFLEWKGKKIVYKRYASLYFVALVNVNDNELITLEKIHLFVEVLDRVRFDDMFALDDFDDF